MAATSRTSRRSDRMSTTRPPERVPWRILGSEFIKRWGRPHGKNQAEHLEILGPNGSGKTYFQAHVLMARARARGSHIVVLSTKPEDDTLDDLKYPDGKPWVTITRWPPPYGKDQVIYAARAKGLSPAVRRQQKESIASLLEEVWAPGSNRILVFDEIGYLQQELGFATHINTMYREARALGLTLVSNTQRPVGTSRYMHSESKWKVAFRPFDLRDAETVAEIFGDKRYWIPILMELNQIRYEFVIQYAPTGEAYISHM